MSINHMMMSKTNTSTQRLLLRKVATSNFWQRGSLTLSRTSSASSFNFSTSGNTTTTTATAATTRLPSNANPIPVETSLAVSQHVIAVGESMDFALVADKLGIRLTTSELAVLRKKLDSDGDGKLSHSELNTAATSAMDERSARELFLSVVETPISTFDKMGAKMITILDYTGTALFAIVGSQVAGNAGMNIIGCGLVGCVAALGGGTLNSIFYGVSSPLFGKSGVFWARNHWYVAIALGSAIITFYGWPAYCRNQAEQYVDNVIGKENLTRSGRVSKRAFVQACQRNAKFMETLTIAFPADEANKSQSPESFFNQLDPHKVGSIDVSTLETLAQKKFDNSVETYIMDSAALGAFSVAAVHGAIGAGLHPLVAATSGVTICFGGLFRDVFCNRDLAIAGQSYALATGAGSTVYVFLRELTLRGLHLSLLTRTVLSVGTCVGLRAWEYIRGAPLLQPMHSRRDRKIELTRSLSKE